MSEHTDRIDPVLASGERAEPGRPGIWRLRHGDKPWWVGFLDPQPPIEADRRNLVLIATGDRTGFPPEAIQFGRRRDAEMFATIFLAAHIRWVAVEEQGPAVWSEAMPPDPFMGLADALEEMQNTGSSLADTFELMQRQDRGEAPFGGDEEHEPRR